jgi:hypothetical protein
MSIDWTHSDFVFLKNQLSIGRVCLFAGAGFSLSARNANGEKLPLGGTLAEKLALKAGMSYQNESLTMVYEAVEPIIGRNNLWSYLSDLYTVVNAEYWYEIAMSLTWFRIYTTNIDNLFQFLQPFKSGQRLDMFVKGDFPEERQPHFDKLQCIHLHGHINYRTNGLTFSPQDFAKHTARRDTWYQTLVDDIQNMPILFIGTTLEEPILSHYLELRDSKPMDADKEFRPKSFLISPNISAIRAGTLKQRNIIPVSETAESFFISLADNLGLLDFHHKQVQTKVWPHLFGVGKQIRSDIATDFDPIIPSILPITRRTHKGSFFLGAEPTWDDINMNRDALRQVNQDLCEVARKANGGFQCIVLHGPAGSGKTTCLMQAAVSLASEGQQVYFAKGNERLSLDGILALAKSLENEDKQVVAVIDVVSRHIGSISSRIKALQSQANLTLVMSDRTNRYASRSQQFAELDPIEIKMPDLSEVDAISVIEKLEHFGFLGALRGKTRAQQVNEFVTRASRQLLIALREATSGKDFDTILENEFGELTEDAKLAYTICCIAVAKGAPGVYRKHLSACLPKTRFSKGVVIDDLLRGILVPGGDSGTLLKPRHGVIAHLVANSIAPIELRYQAVLNFLIEVASYIVPNQIGKRTPPFLAYRGMVNSEGLFDLFAGDVKLILSLYEEVRPYYDGDFLFWLQYAMAHTRAGNLDVAENYLNQSLSIRSSDRNHQAQHQRGILYLLKALSSENPASMIAKAKEGMAILIQQIRELGDHDSYPYHAYLTQVSRWYATAGSIIPQSDWEELRSIANEARSKYRLDDGIRDAANDVERKYLLRVVVSDD